MAKTKTACKLVFEKLVHKCFNIINNVILHKKAQACLYNLVDNGFKDSDLLKYSPIAKESIKAMSSVELAEQLAK